MASAWRLSAAMLPEARGFHFPGREGCGALAAPMKGPSFPTATVAFHAVALLFFGGCVAGLVRESQALGGRRGMVDLGVAVAAGGLALVSAWALGALVRSRAVSAVRSHSQVGTYVQVLAAMVGLGLLGLHLVTAQERPALGVFCLGLAVWLGGPGLHWVPPLFLGPDGFIDSLGRRTPFARLEWFTLQKQAGEPPRVLLQAGHGALLHLEARLASADAEGLRARLQQAGLSPRK